MKFMLFALLLLQTQSSKDTPTSPIVPDSSWATAYSTPQPPCGDFGASLNEDGRCQIKLTFTDQIEELKCAQKDNEVTCTWKPFPERKQDSR